MPGVWVRLLLYDLPDSDSTNKQTLKRNVASFAFFFFTVTDLDINFPKYPACETRGFIGYSISIVAYPNLSFKI